jgi:hypothetical protein
MADISPLDAMIRPYKYGIENVRYLKDCKGIQAGSVLWLLALMVNILLLVVRIRQ